MKKVDEYLEHDIFKQSEQEQDKQILKLISDYKKEAQELKETEKKASDFLAILQEKTKQLMLATIALDTEVSFKT